MVDAELVADEQLLPATRPAAPLVHTDRDHHLSDDTRQALADSVPENTQRAYARQWETFTNWCATQGRVPLPATPVTLAEYVRHLTVTPSQRTGSTPAPSSIEQAIGVIRSRHKSAGYRDQPDTTAALRLLAAYKKRRAKTGTRKRKAPPLNLAKLRLLVGTCDLTTLAG